MIEVYGLKNCDTCRKARKWLDGRGLAFSFHDLRAAGLEQETLDRWLEALGWEALLNRRGTTWRNLPEEERNGLDASRARQLMLRHPALIKRPVFERDGETMIGFDEAVRDRLREAGRA